MSTFESESIAMTHITNTDDAIKSRQQVLTFILETLAAVVPNQELPPEAATLSLRQLSVGSLGAIALQYRMNQRFGKRLPLETMLSDASLNKLAELFAHNGTETEILL